MRVNASKQAPFLKLATDSRVFKLSRLGHCGLWAWGLSLASTSCRSAEQRDVTREVATIAYAVNQLRQAPSDAKARPLEALHQLPCSSPPACELKQVCAQAYRLHVDALSLASQAAAAIREGQTAHGADKLLSQAERDLEHAKEGAHQCVQLEGALARKYKL